MKKVSPPLPVPIKDSLTRLGADVGTWRRLRNLTAKQVADRAGVSASTLLRLEAGNGASLENVLRIVRALGLLEKISSSLDPYTTDVGRLRADEILPKRVRHRTGKRQTVHLIAGVET